MGPPVNYDDRGRAYVGVGWNTLIEGNPDPDTCLMLFVPREPLGAGAPRPTTLTAKFDASVFAGWKEHGVNLIRDGMTISLPLPEAGSSIEEAFGGNITLDGRPRTINYGGNENLETRICRARANQYGVIRDGGRPDTPEIRSYVYWMERAVAARVSIDVRRDRADLAGIYPQLGDVTPPRRLLFAILQERRFLKPLMLPPDRSRAGFTEAEEQVLRWNERYYREAREILRELNSAKRNAAEKH